MAADTASEDTVNDDQLDLGASFGDAAARPSRRRPRQPRGSRCATWRRAAASKASTCSRPRRPGRPRRASRSSSCKLSDRTGTVDCTVWEVDDDGVRASRAGDLVTVGARVTEYQGKAQLEATRVACRPGRRRQAARFPSLHLPRHRGAQGLPSVPHRLGLRPRLLRAAASASSATPSSSRRFTTAPAAKVYHHAYLGGLVEHTVAVAEMCDFVAQQYGRVDRDLLLTAALLHDVGKTRELSFETTIDFTDAGQLPGPRHPGSHCWSPRRPRSCRRSPKPSSSSCCTASSAITASWSGARPSARRPSRR